MIKLNENNTNKNNLNNTLHYNTNSWQLFSHLTDTIIYLVFGLDTKLWKSCRKLDNSIKNVKQSLQKIEHD